MEEKIRDRERLKKGEMQRSASESMQRFVGGGVGGAEAWGGLGGSGGARPWRGGEK